MPEHDEGPDLAAVPEPQSERANLLARVRELREEAQGDHHLDLPLPGLGDYVWARFRPFPFEKTERKIEEFRRAQGKQPIIVKAACDTLIEACEQIMLLPERFKGDPGQGGANLIPIDDEAVPPIRFDERLAEAFGFNKPSMTARQVVRAMFPTEQSIVAMNVRVSEWMQDVTRESDQQLLGE